MKSISASKMRAIDARTIRECGIPGLQLMENAGRGVARVLCEQFLPKSVLILCGKGNNGGDGFVVARLLHEQNIGVTVLALDPKEYSGDALINYERLLKLKVPIAELFCEATRLNRILEKSDLIVDALFGTGLSRNLSDDYISVIAQVNRCGRKILAIDIPSGLHADTGEVIGSAIHADLTVTLAIAKHGLFRGKGPNHCGVIEVVDIGIPSQLLAESP